MWTFGWGPLPDGACSCSGRDRSYQAGRWGAKCDEEKERCKAYLTE